MDADRQAVAFRRRVDRPVLAATERGLGADQQHHLDETAVGGAAVDLIHRQFGVLHRHDDGRAQPGVAVQPFPGDPVVQRAGHGDAKVLAELRLDAVQAVADREPGAERIQRLPAEGGDVGAGAAGFVAPVLPETQRIAGGIADRGQVLDAAPDDGFPPVVIQVGQQRGIPGNDRVDVAVDRRRLASSPGTCTSRSSPSALIGIHRDVFVGRRGHRLAGADVELRGVQRAFDAAVLQPALRQQRILMRADVVGGTKFAAGQMVNRDFLAADPHAEALPSATSAFAATRTQSLIRRVSIR